MKLQIFTLLCMVLLVNSCAYNPPSSDEITAIQIRSLDMATIRPRIISLLGRDSAGLDAVSMITTYEEFLASQYPLDTTDQTPPEAPKSSQWYWDFDPRDPHYINTNREAPNNPRKPKIYVPRHGFLQLLHQQGKMWIGQLNDFHAEYYHTKDIGFAKKGVAAGYNALLSGPTLNEIQKIEEKLMPLVDTLRVTRKIFQ